MKMFVEPADAYLYMDIVDFRKSINGLIVVVEQSMGLNALLHDDKAMNIGIENLPDDPATLKKMLLQVMSRYQYLEEQFCIAQHKQFGQSTEGHPGQSELFNEAEELAVEPDTQEEAISSPLKKPTRKVLPKDLPREVIVHDISDKEKVCDRCAGELHRIGEDKSENLQFIPAQVKVIKHVRPKYTCRTCEKEGISHTVKQAPCLTALSLKVMRHRAY